MENTTITHDKTGAKSSYCPNFSLIPYDALVALAKRFELGDIRYGRGNWEKGIPDVEYVKERLNHVIGHVYALIQKLDGNLPWDEEDDAAAILWGGAFAVMASKYHFRNESKS